MTLEQHTEVTQEDHDRAEAFWNECFTEPFSEQNGTQIYAVLRYAFAEHREAAMIAGTEAMREHCASMAQEWRDGNKDALHGSRPLMNSSDMLYGAQVECNAMMKAIRALDPSAVIKGMGHG